MDEMKLGPHAAIVAEIGNMFGSGDETAHDFLSTLESAGYEVVKANGGCWINGCKQEAKYRAEGFPIGSRIVTCGEHIAQAANYFTDRNHPLLVIPLRFT